jgi:tetratricopeptide (TPR) repeat protein
VLQKFAGALSLARQFDEANERLRAAEEMIGKNDAVKPRTRGEFLQTKGDVLAAQNRPAEAAAGYKEAAAIFETEFAKAPDNRYWADALPGIYSRLADSYKQSGDTKQANEALQKAQDRYREIESKRPLTPDEQKSRDALANRTAHQ